MRVLRQVDQVAIRAIRAMLAPVVLMTTAAILAGGIQTTYAAVDDRMRAMAAEKFSRLTGSGELTSVMALPDTEKLRLRQIDTELPLLLRRHWMLHNILLLIYTSVPSSVWLLSSSVSESDSSVGLGTMRRPFLVAVESGLKPR
jgi:hypothetical protein